MTIEYRMSQRGMQKGHDFFEGVLDHADRRFRTCIDRLAQGVWRAEEPVDNDCFEPIDGRIAVTITVKDQRMIVDFAGTSPQIRGFKNSSIANSTYTMTCAPRSETSSSQTSPATKSCRFCFLGPELTRRINGAKRRSTNCGIFGKHRRTFTPC